MRVSVVVPCHNTADYLAQAVGSALNQSHPPLEVLIVDDASTDGSRELAHRLAAGSGGVVRVLEEEFHQASRARNAGAVAARGDALLFLDADDVLGPDALEALVQALRGEPSGVAVCPWFRLEQADGDWVRRPPTCAPRRPGQAALDAWLTGWYHPPCSVLWSREGFERAGRWDELCAVNQDGDLMMRALALGVRLVQAPRGAAYYRRHPEGRTSLSGRRSTRAGVESRIRVLDKVTALLEDQGDVRAHRVALGQARTGLAASTANEHPDLAGRLRADARRLDPLLDARRVARFAVWRARRISRHLPRRVDLGSAEAVPVRHGLDRGAQLLATATGGSAAEEPPVPPKRPAVSVIVPTYNRASLLQRALDSALGQTMADLEVLVVDDGSSDDTAETVAGYDDPRIRYLPQPRNMGVAVARNRGLRESRGELVALLDSDDEWFPDKLALQVDRLRSLGDRVGVLYGAVEDDDARGNRLARTPTHRGDVHRALLLDNVVHGTSSALFRRSVVAAVGFFDESLAAIEDYDFWLRAARFFHFDFVEEPVARYHDPRGVERKSLALEDNLLARVQFFRKHRAEMRRAGVAHLFLVRSARRHLRGGDVRGARMQALRAVRERPTSTVALRTLARSILHRPAGGPPAPRRGRPTPPRRA